MIANLEYVCSSIRSNTTTAVSFSYSGRNNIEAIAEALQGPCFRLAFIAACANRSCAPNTSVQSLKLESCHIGEVGAKAISKALCACPALTCLKLFCSEINEAGVLALTTTFSNVNVLNLTGTRLGESGFTSIARALPSSNIQRLCLNNTGINDAGAVVLAEALSVSPLQSLEILYHQMRDIGASAIAAEALQNLEMFKFDIEGVTAAGMHFFCQKLRHASLSSTLKSLTLSSFTSDAVVAVCESLKHTLECLKLVRPLSVADAEIANDAIATLLRHNTVLKTLDFRQKANVGMEAIVESLSTNSTLTKLDLSANDIDNRGALAISNALKINTTLCRLDLAYNWIDEEGVKSIASALAINTTLTALFLQYNFICDEGVFALAEAARINTTLMSLRIHDQDAVVRRKSVDALEAAWNNRSENLIAVLYS